jgi:murein L,D-transpeptidase YcbB/YkuD
MADCLRRFTARHRVAGIGGNLGLTRPIQVILFYTTAVVMPEDGTIRFAEDIHCHDAKLDRALRRALAPVKHQKPRGVD